MSPDELKERTRKLCYPVSRLAAVARITEVKKEEPSYAELERVYKQQRRDLYTAKRKLDEARVAVERAGRGMLTPQSAVDKVCGVLAFWSERLGEAIAAEADLPRKRGHHLPAREAKLELDLAALAKEAGMSAYGAREFIARELKRYRIGFREPSRDAIYGRVRHLWKQRYPLVYALKLGRRARRIKLRAPSALAYP